MADNTRTVPVELPGTVRACRREILPVTGSSLAASAKTEMMVAVNNVITVTPP